MLLHQIQQKPGEEEHYLAKSRKKRILDLTLEEPNSFWNKVPGFRGVKPAWRNCWILFFFFFIVMGFVIHWNEKKLLNSLGDQHQGGRRFWCTPCSLSVTSSIQTPHADIPLPNAQGTLQNSQGRRRHPDWQRSCGRKALSIGGLVRQETHFYYMFNEFQLWLFVLFLSATLSHLQI